MTNKRFYLLLSLSMLFLISCLCGGMSSFIPNPTPMPTRADILPAVGDWIAKVDFGEIKFTVEATGVISYWEFVLHTEPCGTGLLNSSYASWLNSPIEDNSFSVTYQGTKKMGDRQLRVEYKLEGTFSPDFKSASGTWAYSFNYGKCNGTWQATK